MQTWLFVPGHQPDRIRKAVATEADRVIVDWEDAVAPEHRSGARHATAKVIEELDAQQRVVIRINPATAEEHQADLDAVAAIRPAAVMVAKTERPETTRALAERKLPCVPLIESALGVERAFDIASMPGVYGLAFGCVDYLGDIRAAHSQDTLLYPRSRLVNAARAAGLKHILDGPTIALDDDTALAEQALHARSLGFSGKLAIHPKQVVQLQQIFRPSDADIARAREIIRLYQEALQQGKGAIRHGDLMIDGAVAKQARWILEAGD